MNDDLTAEFFPKWVAAALAEPNELNTFGTELTGRDQLIGNGLKELILGVVSWLRTNDSMSMPWQYDSVLGRDASGNSMIVVLSLCHGSETHKFFLYLDWITNATHVYKEEDNNATASATPRCVSTSA